MRSTPSVTARPGRNEAVCAPTAGTHAPRAQAEGRAKPVRRPPASYPVNLGAKTIVGGQLSVAGS
jgi:hypothetical protein